MSSHSLSPALCPHIKAGDPPLRSPGEGKEQQGHCWSLGCCPERAGHGEGLVTDFTRWARRREGCGEEGACAAWWECLRLTPVPGQGVGRKHGHKQTRLPAPSSPSSLSTQPKPQQFCEGPMGRTPVSAPAWLSLPQPPATSLMPRGSLAESKREPKWSRNSKGEASRQTWPQSAVGHKTLLAGIGLAASCACPTQPLHK